MTSFSPDDHLRHWMYVDIAQIVQSMTCINPVVLDFGSKWFGDEDGGWRTNMRTVLKARFGRTGFEHVLATFPEYDIETPRSQQYDIIVADQVLEHVKRPWRAADGLARSVKSGGYLMVATPGLYPVHPSPLDCWRIMPDGYDVLFPKHLWSELTKKAWGTAQRVGFEYSDNGAFPYGPPTTTVDQAVHQPHYTPSYDGRCPLMLWLVAQRTDTAIQGDEW